jgi:hypothetical protein
MVQMRAGEPLHALPGCDAVPAHRALLPLPFFARGNYPGVESVDGRSGRWRLALQELAVPAGDEHLVRLAVGGVHEPLLGVGRGGRRRHVGQHLPLGLRTGPGRRRHFLPLELAPWGGGHERQIRLGLLQLEAVPVDRGLAVVLGEPEILASRREEGVAEEVDLHGAEEAADARRRRTGLGGRRGRKRRRRRPPGFGGSRLRRGGGGRIRMRKTWSVARGDEKKNRALDPGCVSGTRCYSCRVALRFFPAFVVLGVT